ncbi:MAG: iron-containing alcohol dehydrogenase [Chloroflexota bacterium]|nr:MAG: iron-containing alcohol dehydrogenase [Chloroflexota bacterium]
MTPFDASTAFELRLPSEGFLFAPGAVGRLGTAIAERGGWRVLVLLDGGVSAALSAPMRDTLSAAGLIAHIETCHPGLATPNDLDDLRRMRRDGDYDTILAIGGGAVTDRGRLAAGVSRDDDGAAGLFIAAPTTAGTGVEATDRVWVKESSAARHLTIRRGRRPDLLVFDPDVLAIGGTHAVGPAAAWLLCEALDGLFHPGTPPYARPLLRAAIGLVTRHAQNVVDDRSNGEARAALMTANLLAVAGLSGSRLSPPGALAAVVAPRSKVHPGAMRAKIARYQIPRWRAGDPGAISDLAAAIADDRRERHRSSLAGDVFDIITATLALLVPVGEQRPPSARESERSSAVSDALAMLASDGVQAVDGERLLALARQAL